MKVRCERNCIQNVDGYCTRSELDVSVDGTCEDFVERVKFEAFRDDNVVVFDDVGLPFVMVRFSGEEHYVERDEFFTRDQDVEAESIVYRTDEGREHTWKHVLRNFFLMAAFIVLAMIAVWIIISDDNINKASVDVDLEKGAQNTSQENGRVGGEMVKRMIDSQKKQMSKSK